MVTMSDCNMSEMSCVIFHNVPKNEIQGLGRERVEMMVESADDFRTQTHLHTNRQQPLQCTGSDSVQNRSHRSVLECLVVLCVLLLTAVIVLCVLIYTNNHQFIINKKNITEERDQLLTNNIKLTQERDQLLTKYTKLTEERDQIRTENVGLSTNIYNLNKQKDQLTKQISGLLESLKPVFTDGWISIQSSFYFISSEKKNWTESRRYCTERGADLIIINNKEEQDFVKRISGLESHWIGLFYSDLDSVWNWVDGSTSTSSFWTCGEPNDPTNQKCMISYTYSYACPCYSAFKWICEKNLF